MAALIVALLAVAGASGTAHAEDAPTFERDVKPLFVKRCAVCHNAKKLDNADISGGLALDTYDAAIKGTKAHTVVVAGKPGESELMRRLVEKDEEKRMPLSDKPLSDQERRVIESWVAAGAPRGVAPAASSAATVVRRRKVVRALDLVIPVDTKVPPGVAGMGSGGAVQLALKVGPLPAITALAFRGDGRLLAVGTHGAVVVWDLAEARPAVTMNDVPGPVHALAFSRDGKRLAVGAGLPARTGCVRIYAVPGGTLIHDFEGHGDVVFGLAFRPDGAQLASASLDQTVRFWNLSLGRADGVFRGHSDFVYDLTYTRDGHAILSASKDRTVKQIDARTAKERRTYSDHDNDVLAVAIQPGGAKFVSTGNEPNLRWWALDGEKPSAQQGGHSGPVHQLAFSADGRRLISAGGDGTVRVWDGQSGAHVRALAGASDWQYAAILSADGRIAAAGGWDGLVRVWDAESGTLRATMIHPPSDNAAQVEWLAVVPSGYVSASPGLTSLIRWKVGGAEIPRDKPLALFSHPEEVAHALAGLPLTAVTFPKTN
jgi:mono/diheme cytochrome c family protein